MIFLSTALLIVASGFVAPAQATEPPLIPRPKAVDCGGRDFVIGSRARILLPKDASPDVRLAGDALVRALREATGRTLPAVTGGAAKERRGSFLLRLHSSDGELGPEGYTLTIGRSVILEAATGRGLFYAVQTLRQMIRNGSPTAIAGCKIQDWPSWPYRGIMLDPARNYMTVEFLKRQIDMASSYKLNYFHLHLTDNEGWRLEIKAYPNLVSEKHYAQDELRELVVYAKARFVTLVPEIEMPGHAAAFIAKVPDLGHKGILCVGNEKTYAVLGTIWKETAAIFDGPYLHLGGDETNDDLECPLCRHKWEELQQSADPPGSLVVYFLGRMHATIKSLGRQTMAWSVDKRHWRGVLPKDIVIMAWTSGAVDHARQGYRTINTYVKPLYFDHLHPIQAFLNWAPDDSVAEKLPALMGAEAEAWHDPPVNDQQQILADLGYYPRLLAFAERVWRSADRPSMADFEARLLQHKARYFRDATFPYPPPVRDASKPYPY